VTTISVTTDSKGNKVLPTCNRDGGVQTHATQQHNHVTNWATQRGYLLGSGGNFWSEGWLNNQAQTYNNPMLMSKNPINITGYEGGATNTTSTIKDTTVAPETVFVDTTETRPFNYGVYYLIKY
jgi:hypothetical protein